jgi:hypothetical protein
MKIILIPALCQWPLIEASHSATNNVTIKMECHPAGFLARMVAKVRQAIASRVPVGYEDATGFHHGVAEVPLPVIRTRRIRNQPSVKTCLKARWIAMRASNLNSGGQLVLQWDSSSLPPCRLSPESFSTESQLRHLAGAITNQCPASFTSTRGTGRSRFLDFHAGHWSRSSTITSTA